MSEKVEQFWKNMWPSTQQFCDLKEILTFLGYSFLTYTTEVI